MKRIDLSQPRLGADGIIRSWEEIEEYFLKLFHDDISENLSSITEEEVADNRLWDFFNNEIKEDHLRSLLIGKPQELKNYVNKWNELVYNFTSDTDKANLNAFKNILKENFNYDGFRVAKLNRIAVVLNIKTCLYCNQQYTVTVGKNPNSEENISLVRSDAYLQFDHYFDKSSYPFLSMSLYNLIPCCPFCNQKKSAKKYPIDLHPYKADYSSLLKFRIKDLNALTSPKKLSLDLMEVEIDAGSNEELKSLIKDLDLERRYCRHLDLVKELECNLYLKPYYEEILPKALVNITNQENWKLTEDILQRSIYGFYPDEKDINRRPLTKFCQDISAQLASYCKSESHNNEDKN